jgi:hypothetical protein
MASLRPAGSTSTDYGAAATTFWVQVSFLPDNASALHDAKNFAWWLDRFLNALDFLLSAFLDRIVDERRLPAM